MKFTLSWLFDHLETSASLKDIITKLTELGHEVEKVDDPSITFQGFVVGQVLKVEPHPQADRLKLCQVDSGKSTLQVVCGASNVYQGMKVAFAPVGVTIPQTGQVLKKSVIRSVESQGMMCSVKELGLGDDHEGILDLQTEKEPGTSLAQALEIDDPVIELSLTPNRADCFSVRGIARDLAASGLGTLKPLEILPIKGDFVSSLQVNIQHLEDCPVFYGRLIKNVKNSLSPRWLQKRLKAIGLRPLSALVDITNYLTYDLGRPLHVFDVSKIEGDLYVRPAKQGEQLNGLNEKTYDLQEKDIVIADEKKVLALGGILGGIESACSESTTDVFIECALFSPVQIAKTGQAHQILSDARTRFERGVDPESIVYGLHKATEMIVQICGGEVSEIVQAGTLPFNRTGISLTEDKLKRLTGMAISLTEATDILKRLGFEEKEKRTFISPSFRYDVHIEEDLIEEILRIKGYHTIPSIPLPPSPSIKSKDVRNTLRRLIAARGFYETVTWSFISEKESQLFEGKGPKLSNPISQDHSTMRTCLFPSLLKSIRRNEARSVNQGAFFEISPFYKSDFSQENVLSGLRYGYLSLKDWQQKERMCNVFDIKADLIMVLNHLGFQEESFQIDLAPSYYHPGRRCALKLQNKPIAFFGELHPCVLKHFDIINPVVGFELFLDRLPAIKSKKKSLELSPYQIVERDFAFLLERYITARQLLNVVRKVDKELITEVRIFDVYQGDKLPKDKKSIAFQVKLEPKLSTLTEADIQSLSQKIIESVQKEVKGELRSA
ncbi:MAG: phenylalanine--tRNA ligase subunit beta [Proteobacteria bacterium]|nr:phenylalanine--tRNA ligase subunit beta [Pseudomonadota bacterium]